VVKNTNLTLKCYVFKSQRFCD